jgi:uridylate kinase
MEIQAEAILKATKVDGVFDKDPVEHTDAVLYDRLSYIEVLQKGLKVMDSTAISLCMDNELPIHVFNLNDPENIRRVVMGENVGTVVHTA